MNVVPRQNVKCQMYVYSGHALSYTKLVLRHTTQTEGVALQTQMVKQRINSEV